MKNLDLTYDFSRSKNALEALGQYFLYEDVDPFDSEEIEAYVANGDGNVEVYSISLESLQNASKHEWFDQYRDEFMAAGFLQYDEDGNAIPFEAEIAANVDVEGLLYVALELLDESIPIGMLAKKISRHSTNLTDFVLDNADFFSEELDNLLWGALGI